MNSAGRPDGPNEDVAVSVIPAPGYADLLGLSLTVLDELSELRTAAYEGELPLLTWRQQHADVLASHEQVSSDELAATSEAVSERYGEVFGELFDALSPRSGDRDEAKIEAIKAEKEHLGTLSRQLRALAGPPDDDEVLEEYRDDFSVFRNMLSDRPTDEQRAKASERIERGRRRVGVWLREIDTVERDPGTGLPVEVVERWRTTDDDVLGQVPVSWVEARASAYAAADEEERAFASKFIGPGHSVRGDLDWRTQQAWEAVRRAGATEFVRFAFEDDSAAARHVRELWVEGGLRELLGRFLDERR